MKHDIDSNVHNMYLKNMNHVQVFIENVFRVLNILLNLYELFSKVIQ